MESLERRSLLTNFSVDFSLLEPQDYTHSEILVRFHDHVDVSSLTNAVSVAPSELSHTIMSGPLGQGFASDPQLWEIPVLPGQSVEQLVNHYSTLDIVDFAEPNYRMESAAVPNDQFYNVLWGMPNIDAESAWDTRTDSSSIIVGVIDSGVQYDHPDLIDNIWTNSGEIANNGIDDDGNGYVDDFWGYDFENDDPDPMDTNGHGTHVAGTIGARGNNGTGVAGVGWNASLMSLKVIGTGTNADVARAIDYATDNGAKITNNSYGYAGNGVGGSRAISDAIGRAKDAGVLYVVAAGNSRTNIPASDVDGNFNSWPAEYSKVHDNVITVSAIDSDGSFASYSHWGDESVQIAAPGTQIGSTYTQGRYVYLSGTSMAAPHVAGAAALLWAEAPELSYLDIKDAILQTARPDHLDLVGHGVLDLGAAMALITSNSTPNQSPVADDDAVTVDEDNSIAIAVLDNDSDPDGDELTVDSFAQPTNGTVTNSNSVLTYTPNANFNGADVFTYTISDGQGGLASATVNIVVNAVNDQPVAVNDSASTDEDTAVTFNVVNNDTDVDGDTLTLAAVGNPANGTVTSNASGEITYTPAAGFFGSDSFSYTVSDGSLTAVGTVIVSVSEVNQAPVAGDDNAVVDEDSAVAIVVLDNDTDADSDVLIVDSFGQGSNGSVTNSNSVLTYTPNANFNGTDSFTYTISDGRGGQSTATVNVVINAVNDQPVATDDSTSTDEDTSVTFNVINNDTDVDGDALTLAAAGNPANGTVTSNANGQVTYTPDSGFFGTDSFTYTVSDGSLSATGTVTVTVNEVSTSAEVGFSGIAADVTHVWKTVNLPVDFTDPVVVAGGSTRRGGHQGTVRVRNVTSNSFEIRFQEWDYRDGWHTTEDIGFLVVEAGTHYLSDGTQIVASTIDLTNESTRTLTFETAFTGTPLVLGQVMTDNDSGAITERMRNVTSSNLRIQLNEEEVADGVHATETIGVIAIDRGQADADGLSLNAVVTGNTVTHGNTTVNFGSIGGTASPVILSDMQTRDGGDAATVRHRSSTSTSVTVFVEEEASRDSELNHTTEIVGVLALEAGVITGTSGSPGAASNGAPLGLSDAPAPTYPLPGGESIRLFSGLPQGNSQWQYTGLVMQSGQSSDPLFPEVEESGDRESQEAVARKRAAEANGGQSANPQGESEQDLDSWFAAIGLEGILDRI